MFPEIEQKTHPNLTYTCCSGFLNAKTATKVGVCTYALSNPVGILRTVRLLKHRIFLVVWVCLVS